jgi:hypothetical protein
MNECTCSYSLSLNYNKRIYQLSISIGMSKHGNVLDAPSACSHLLFDTTSIVPVACHMYGKNISKYRQHFSFKSVSFLVSHII